MEGGAGEGRSDDDDDDDVVEYRFSVSCLRFRTGGPGQSDSFDASTGDDACTSKASVVWTRLEALRCIERRV